MPKFTDSAGFELRAPNPRIRGLLAAASSCIAQGQYGMGNPAAISNEIRATPRIQLNPPSAARDPILAEAGQFGSWIPFNYNPAALSSF